MAKYYGQIGYVETIETTPGVYEEQITERNYYGDVIRNARRLEGANVINDNIVVNNSLSIVADAYAFQNFFAIRYARWMGVLWKVTNVEVQSPRLILTLGGVYNVQAQSSGRS